MEIVGAVRRARVGDDSGWTPMVVKLEKGRPSRSSLWGRKPRAVLAVFPGGSPDPIRTRERQQAPASAGERGQRGVCLFDLFSDSPGVNLGRKRPQDILQLPHGALPMFLLDMHEHGCEG